MLHNRYFNSKQSNLEFDVYFRHSVRVMNVLITVAGKGSFEDLYKDFFFFF